jgi:hypothetical protein
LCVGGDALAGDAPCNAQADAQSAANGVRFHAVMMVAATLAELLFADCCRFPVAPRRRRK